MHLVFKFGSDFVLTDIFGNKIHIDGSEYGLIIFNEFKNKIVILNFTGTYPCPFCIKFRNILKKLAKKYKDSLRVISIVVRPDDASSLYIQSKMCNEDVSYISKAQSFSKYVFKRAQFRGSIPAFIIFDKKGESIVKQVGFVEFSKLDKVINSLLSPKK